MLYLDLLWGEHGLTEPSVGGSASFGFETQGG